MSFSRNGAPGASTVTRLPAFTSPATWYDSNRVMPSPLTVASTAASLVVTVILGRSRSVRTPPDWSNRQPCAPLPARDSMTVCPARSSGTRGARQAARYAGRFK